MPSVLAQCETDKEGVSYSGVTYIGLRSSKHNNSSAFTHQEYLLRMSSLMPEVFAKSILIKSVARGPDENPRFHKNKLMLLKIFQVRFHLKRLRQDKMFKFLIFSTPGP